MTNYRVFTLIRWVEVFSLVALVALVGRPAAVRALPQSTGQEPGVVTHWRPMRGAIHPPGREYGAMVYDARRRVTVLFGGFNGSYLNDTWEWDGMVWAQRTPAVSPPGRFHHAMAYDGQRGVVVLFGGSSSQDPDLGDTWEWDGATWTERSPAVSPSGRYGSAMAYDASRHVTVLFSGTGECGMWCPETWLWDGAAGAWTQASAPVQPPGREHHGLAYDAGRRVVVLFGGEGLCGMYLCNDTWEWDGATWSERQPGTTPSAREQISLAYDIRRQVTVLYGGWSSTGRLADTWEWDGATWSLRSPALSPPSLAGYALAYDVWHGASVLFSGSGPCGLYCAQTWEYGP